MADYLLKEDGELVLQEDAGQILLEVQAAVNPPPGWFGYRRLGLASIGRRLPCAPAEPRRR